MPLSGADHSPAGRDAHRLPALAPFDFDAIYGHYFDCIIPTGGKSILQAPVALHLKAIGQGREPAKLTPMARQAAFLLQI